MPDIIQRIRDTYAENPAEALKLLPELFKQYNNGLIPVLPCKEFYSKSGGTVYLIDDGEIIEVMHGGANIGPDGKLSVTVAADDDIFPYREPDAVIDTEPADWCTNGKELSVAEFQENIRFSREAAEEALKEREHRC